MYSSQLNLQNLLKIYGTACIVLVHLAKCTTVLLTSGNVECHHGFCCFAMLRARVPVHHMSLQFGKVTSLCLFHFNSHIQILSQQIPMTLYTMSLYSSLHRILVRFSRTQSEVLTSVTSVISCYTLW